MNKTEIREQEERRQAFKSLLVPSFSTIVSVLCLSDETRRVMRAENRQRQKEALQSRTKQRPRVLKFSRKGFKK